jgi:two-component system, OmpR family, response regulator
MHHILLIDDDEQLGPPLASYFQRFELQLVHATRPSAGLALLRSGDFNAVILDVMLPEMDGFELCRTIRKENDIPIVMLTARGDVMDRVVGLELGADHYLPKPFEPRELVACLQTVLRRLKPNGNGQGQGPKPEMSAAPTLRFNGLDIDTARRSVTRLGAEIALTGTEYELLLLLAREPGKVFHRDDILNQLRGHEADLYTRAVDIVVSRLRKKLEPLDCIKTLRNAGYSLALRRLPL